MNGCFHGTYKKVYLIFSIHFLLLVYLAELAAIKHNIFILLQLQFSLV